MASIHVSARDVTRVFELGGGKSIEALGPVDLDLAKGEFFAVVGPSGCGKSTFLDVLAGLSTPTSGTVTFEGKTVRGTVPEGVGVVFQEDACFPWMSVEQNIAFGLVEEGVERPEIKKRVDEALGLMSLTQFRDARPYQLSGGMRQRVCIARTLVLRPRFILLDEPFGALDQQTRLVMGDELLRLWRETGATILLITHSLDEAVMLADRIGVMSARPGRLLEIIETGWSRERGNRVMEDPRFGVLTNRLWSLLKNESTRIAMQVETTT